MKTLPNIYEIQFQNRWNEWVTVDEHIEFANREEAEDHVRGALRGYLRNGVKHFRIIERVANITTIDFA